MADKKRILITGCSTGIGAYCARKLADNGFDVHATARHDDDLERLRAAGLATYHLEHNDPASIDRLVDNVLSATGGRLDGLFNNAGYAQPGAIEDLPVEALREQMQVNVFAYHQLTRRLLPTMRAQGHGRIVNCSSVLGRCAMPWRGAYTASKFALEALSITLHQELAGTGIYVSLIEPGPIPSNIMVNGVRYLEKYINIETSPHRDRFAERLEELKQAKPPESLEGVEPVYRALNHALTARRPKIHYPVTWQTRAAFALDRILPKAIAYRLFAASA